MPWKIENLSRPWSGTSVYQQLSRHSSAESTSVAIEPRDDRGATLSGALQRLQLTRVRGALLRLVERPSADALAVFYRLATQQTLIGSVDVSCSERDVTALLDDARVQSIGRLLAAEAPTFVAAALGVALLSRSPAPEDRTLLLVLGSCKELSACVAEALAEHGRWAVFALAQHARGKPRCNAIEWLAEAEEPEICGWLLREGALDAEHHHHVAYLCASTGRLHEALDTSQIDDALLTGAASILQLLATSVSAPDIGDYVESSAAIASFIRHTRGRPLSSAIGSALHALADCPYVDPLHAAACRARLHQDEL